MAKATYDAEVTISVGTLTRVAIIALGSRWPWVLLGFGVGMLVGVLL